MSWEQHRYAVERARDYRRRQANDQNKVCQGVNLQGEANSSDAEMLDEVADFLRALDGGGKPATVKGSDLLTIGIRQSARSPLFAQCTICRNLI